MLQIISDSAANKSISADNIQGVGGGKMIIENNSNQSRIGFLTTKVKLAFAK